MQHFNEIKLKKQDDVTIFDIKGDITAFSDPFLNDAYQKANTQGTKKIILKVERDAYINSGGIALLIQLLAQIKRNHQRVVMTGVSDHFQKIFDMVGITKFAKIYTTEEAALKILAAKPKSTATC